MLGFLWNVSENARITSYRSFHSLYSSDIVKPRKRERARKKNIIYEIVYDYSNKNDRDSWNVHVKANNKWGKNSTRHRDTYKVKLTFNPIES